MIVYEKRDDIKLRYIDIKLIINIQDHSSIDEMRHHLTYLAVDINPHHQYLYGMKVPSP